MATNNTQKPSLVTNQITDIYLRKNFQNLQQYFTEQNQLLDFKFLEVIFTEAEEDRKVFHGLGKIPKDLVRCEVSGPGVATFKRGLFDDKNLVISADGAVRLRFFVGTYYNDPIGPNVAATTEEKWFSELPSLDAILTEEVQDIVATMIQDGTGLTWTYDDVLGTLTGNVNFSTSGLTTSDIPEGFNLYFTDERAQDAVGTILLDSSNIDFTYNDGTPNITADLTSTGVTPGTYGSDTEVGVFTVDAKGRITAASNVAITGGGGGDVDSVFGRTGAVVAATNDYTWAQIDKTVSDIADLNERSHTDLTDIGSNTHPQIDTHIASTSNPHSVTAAQAGAVALTGDESVAGIKTFTSIPVLPASNPTTDNQAVRKLYVDTLVTTGARFVGAVNAATTTALPACTYNNGSSGVGATLTANSNGALPSIDGVASALNNTYLIKDQAAQLQNGAYLLTQVGDGSNPWILTRITTYDQSAEIVGGTFFNVLSGTVHALQQWALLTTGTITVGTTGLEYDLLSEAPEYTASNGVQLVGNDFQIDLANTNPSLEVADGGLRSQVDGTTITRTASGLSVGTITDANISGAIEENHGGTGLTSLGAANEVLGVDNAGTALEYKEIVGGANTTVTHSAGQIEISSSLSGAVDYTYSTATMHSAIGTSYTYTNMPAALTADAAQGRVVKDLTGAVQYRIIVNQQVAGFAGAKYRLRYSTNNVTFQDIGAQSNIGDLDVGTGTGVKVGSWENLAPGAKQNVWLQLFGYNGDGIVDPQFRQIMVEFKYNSSIVDGSTSSVLAREITIHAHPSSSVTWTNMPAGVTEFLGDQTNRVKVDLSGVTDYRLMVYQQVAGFAGADLNLQYSLNNSTFFACDTAAAGELDVGTGTGVKAGAWATLVDGAKQDVWLRIVGKDGDGVVDPQFRRVIIQVKNNAFANNGGMVFVGDVDAATTAPLASCTYSNGSGGVGATLTATANGAFPSVDGVASVAGNYYLVKDQVAGLQNGAYELTTLGDGSNPWVLTRITDYDDATEILKGTFFYVQGGTVHGLQQWALITNGAITIGTTTLEYELLSESSEYTASNGIQLVLNDFQIDLSDTNPSLEVADGGLRARVDGTTITRTASGLAVGVITDTNFSGALEENHGGTGLTSIGTANQLLGVNNGATALEYKSLVAGDNVTINNTGDQVEISASLTGAPEAIYTQHDMVSDPTNGFTITNLATALTTLSTNTRIRVDLTGAASYRIGVTQSTAGFAGSKFRLRYSVDNVTFLDIGNESNIGDLDVGTGTGVKVGAWEDLVGAAKADVWLQLFSYDGDGVVDPVFRQIWIEIERNSSIVDKSSTSTITDEVVFHSHPSSSVTWTNMPAAVTEFLGATTSRFKVDLTGVDEYRIVVNQFVAGFAGADLNLQYSLNNSTFQAADTAAAGELDVGTGTGVKVGAWAPLVGGAKGDVWIRLVGKDGDGIVDPQWRQVKVQLRSSIFTPNAGEDTEVIYNNADSFDGDATFTFNNTTKVVRLQELTLNDLFDIEAVSDASLDNVYITGKVAGQGSRLILRTLDSDGTDDAGFYCMINGDTPEDANLQAIAFFYDISGNVIMASAGDGTLEAKPLLVGVFDDINPGVIMAFDPAGTVVTSGFSVQDVVNYRAAYGALDPGDVTLGPLTIRPLVTYVPAIASDIGNNRIGVSQRNERYIDEISANAIMNTLAGGTRASPTIVNSAESVFTFFNLAYDGSEYLAVGNLAWEVDGTPAAGDIKTASFWSVTEGQVSLDLNGNFQIQRDLTSINNVAYSWPSTADEGFLTRDSSGNITFTEVINPVQALSGYNATGLNSSIGGTGFVDIPSAEGTYRINYYLVVATTDAGAGTVDCTFQWDDPTATGRSFTSSSINMTGLNYTQGSIIIRKAASTTVSHSHNVSGTPGTATFNIYLSVEKIA